jgi:hypothetical protein
MVLMCAGYRIDMTEMTEVDKWQRFGEDLFSISQAHLPTKPRICTPIAFRHWIIFRLSAYEIKPRSFIRIHRISALSKE